MTEPLTDEKLEKHRAALNCCPRDYVIWQQAVALELLAEVDRLKALLARWETAVGTDLEDAERLAVDPMDELNRRLHHQ